MGLDIYQGRANLDHVAKTMAETLNWDEKQLQEQIWNYHRCIEEIFPHHHCQ